eukprot:SAG31_NODE_14918_length_780_cov_2.176211_1_plen_169_part_10
MTWLGADYDDDYFRLGNGQTCLFYNNISRLSVGSDVTVIISVSRSRGHCRPKKGVLEKGKYAWKPGLYTIHKKKKRGFILKDKDGNKQARRYMGYELQLVDPDIQVSKDYSEDKARKAKKAKAKAKAKKKQKRQLAKEGISWYATLMHRICRPIYHTTCFIVICSSPCS